MSKIDDLERFSRPALRRVVEWLGLQGRVVDDFRGWRKPDFLFFLEAKLNRDQVDGLLERYDQDAPFFEDHELAAVLGLPLKDDMLDCASREELREAMETLDLEGRVGVAWRSLSADALRDYLRSKCSKKEVGQLVLGIGARRDGEAAPVIDTRRSLRSPEPGPGTVAHEIDRLLELQEQHRGRQDGSREFQLHPQVEDWLASGLDRAPRFDDFASAARHIIRTIHSIPDLFDDVERGDLELYVGRAGATPSHVLSRFQDHYTSKKEHTFGMVVIRCDTKVVALWEGVANRVIKLLEHRKQLCVANIKAHGGGGMPAHEESSIYLTWKILDRTMPTKVTTRRDIDQIAADIAEQEDRIHHRELHGALSALTSPDREKTGVDWQKGHED